MRRKVGHAWAGWHEAVVGSVSVLRGSLRGGYLQPHSLYLQGRRWQFLRPFSFDQRVSILLNVAGNNAAYQLPAYVYIPHERSGISLFRVLPACGTVR